MGKQLREIVSLFGKKGAIALVKKGKGLGFKTASSQYPIQSLMHKVKDHNASQQRMDNAMRELATTAKKSLRKKKGKR